MVQYDNLEFLILKNRQFLVIKCFYIDIQGEFRNYQGMAEESI